MDIVVEKNIDHIDKNQWNALAQNNEVNTIYQTFEWNRASARVYGKPDGGYILCVKDKDELLAIVPLMFSVSGSKRTLQFLAGQRSDYGDILCPARQEEVLATVWQYIFSRRREWDLIHLNNVPLQSACAKYINENKELKNLSHRCAQVEAALLRFHDDEAYTKSVLNKKRVHKYRTHLKENGHYEILHLTRPLDIENHIEDFFTQHIERWRKTLFPSLFNDEKNKQFYRHIIRELPQGWITFSILKWEGQVLGYHFGFSYGKRFIWYKPTFNVSFARYSPGQVLLQEVMEYAYAKRFEEFDFGGGKDAYKNRFSNKTSWSNSFKIYPSRGEYLCYYVPIALQWRWGKLKEQIKLEKFFAKTV